MVFHEYLFGNQFMVKLDNNPLTCIMTTAQLDAMVYCWVAQLALYDFMVMYKPGKTNIEADALSRINCNWELTSEVVRVILNTAMDGHGPLAKICAHTMTVVPSFLVASGITRLKTEEAMQKEMTATDWAKPRCRNRILSRLSVCTKQVSWIWPSYVILSLGRLKLFYTTDSN